MKPGHQVTRSPGHTSDGKLFVISGPSGSGKTTIAQRVLQVPALKAKISRSISFTTRPRRSHEQEGRDYFFLTPAQFQALLGEKKILEWTRYLGYYYGTPKDFVDTKLEAGRHLLMCLDLQGARTVKRLYPEQAVTIFIQPPSLEVLEGRIAKRCNKTKAQEIQQRIKLAEKELLAKNKFDYCLVNKELKKVVQEATGIILNRINA